MQTMTSKLEPKFAAYRDTLILGVLLVLFTTHRHSGTFLMLLVPIFCVWIPYSLFVIFRSPDRRQIQINKLIFWSVLIAFLSCLHWYYYYSTREFANSVVIKIIGFKDSEKRYPSSLTEVGISNDQLKENLGLAGYFKEENSMPQFFYSSTFDGFDTYYFDFKNNKWNYHAD
jgi:hypothetical protein